MMTLSSSFSFVGFAVLLAVPAAMPAALRAGEIDFNRDVRPILSNTCFTCHGPDAAERKADLRLDTSAGARADLGGYAAVVPGKPEQSEALVRLLSKDPEEIMPPPKSGKHISPREIEILRAWIAGGADYQKHWAYEVPVRSPLPTVKDPAWPRRELDRYILSRLDAEGLRPQPEADRATLARRVALDLTGLPPSPEEVAAFVADASPGAYEAYVARQLKKPSYGEHWARMWLDLSRYADSAGYADDPLRSIWPFRDYVIRSFNENKPFDQFTIEQIAGDLLPNPSEEQLKATAFHRNTMTNSEGGTNDEEFRNAAVIDRVNTTWSVWMGSSMACAQCHTHKYDPISQKEYFASFAFFNQSEDSDRKDEAPVLEFFTQDQKAERSRLEAEISALDQALKTPTPSLLAAQSKWESAFPMELAWQTPRPLAVTAASGSLPSIQPDGAILVGGPLPDQETTEVTLPLEPGTLAALRLEALTDAALPGQGPGRSGGNFVLSGISASLHPPEGGRVSGRYVRVELPGEGSFLHLAEVQAFSGADNLAVKGLASQSTTGFGGEAGRANDGNTDGDYRKNSVSHTNGGKDQWWEVDLKAEVPVDRIVVWNRTDGDTAARIKGYRVVLLDAKRQPVWESGEVAVPEPSRELALSGVRPVAFSAALADHEQSGYPAADLVAAVDPKKPGKGWAIGGGTGKPHTLTLLTKQSIDVPAGSRLVVRLDQKDSAKGHLLGRFRLGVTADPRAGTQARTPAPILGILAKKGETRSEAERQALTTYYLKDIAPDLAKERTRRAEATKALAALKPSSVPIMRELPKEKGRVTHVQVRGNFENLEDEVGAGVPAVFHPLPDGLPPNRLALAKWIVDERNPLTARVIVNRFWEHLFGIGLVRTSEEFGTQGELPSHPALLDWLATEFVRSGWNMQHLLTEIVTSATYRQSSRVTPDLYERDPDNRLLARGPRFRLSAEMVRDQALAVAGLLSDRIYGPSVRPEQPKLGLNAAFGGAIDWQVSTGADKYRRGLYTEWRRTNPYPSMITFDAPNREVCTVRRVRTNTPLQALVTMNDPVYIEAAQALARKVMKEGGASPDGRIGKLFALCLSRPPSPDEVAALAQLAETSLAHYRTRPDQAMEMATQPLGALPGGMDPAEAAAWTNVSSVVLNLDEVLMKR